MTRSALPRVLLERQIWVWGFSFFSSEEHTHTLMPWKGGHTSALGEQVYDTPEWLAEKVVRVAREEEDADLYVELGVGGGALWRRWGRGGHLVR